MDYLLKANAIIVLFYFCYKLLLQKETFFESNRYFLLFGLAISCIIPFIVIPIYVSADSQLNELNFITPENIINTPIEDSINFSQVLELIYFFGTAIFIIKFLIEFIGLYLVLTQNKKYKKDNYIYVETRKNHSPFSFFNYIVYNPNHFNKKELKLIIIHEKAHAKQYHSIDILITRMATILFWFNPILWLYNKSLQQNLEFIADKNAQYKITDVKSYQSLLLKTVLSNQQATLVNNFYNSLIKKRIIMLQKSKSNKTKTWKYTIILPLLALFLMSFNTKEVYTITNTSNAITRTNTLNLKAEKTVIITKDHSELEFENIKKQFFKFNVILKFKDIRRNSNGEIIAIRVSFKTKEGNKGNFNISKQKPIDSFKFYYNTNTGDSGFNTLKNNTLITKGEPNKDIIILSNNKEEENNISIKDNGKMPSTSFIWNTKDDTVIELKESDDVIEIRDDKKTLFIRNGVPISRKELENINPNKIIRLNSLKENRAKNNAISIIKEEDNNDIIIKNNNNSLVLKNGAKLITNNLVDKNNYIYFLDGKQISKSELEKVYSKETVSSLNILRGDAAIKKYGNKGKYGVVEVTSK